MRISSFLLSVLTAGSLKATAQQIPDPAPFAASITAADLKTHLYKVASKEFEGRETATEGQRKAAAYIEDHFRSVGLLPGNTNSYQLYYPIFQDSITQCTIEVGGQVFYLNMDFILNLTDNHTATLYGSEVIFTGYGISDDTEDDYKGLDVKGKIVLVLSGMPDGKKEDLTKRRNVDPKLEAAWKNGAAGVLVVQKGTTGFHIRRDVKSGLHLKEYKSPIYPNAFYVSEKVAEAIMGKDYETAKAGTLSPGPHVYPVDIKLDFIKSVTTKQSSDVLGFLEGTDLKDEIVVISAHYDHLGKKDTTIYYGADDDGSGTVSVLEMAQAFAKAKAAGKGPRRSILFLANSGEEKGLWGSEYYSDHPVYPMDRTTVDLNIDMVGRIDPNRKKGDSTNYVYVIGDDKLSSELKPISEAQNKQYTHLELDYKYNDPKDPERIYYRSDHYNFARKGVPIIFYFDGIHKDYHQPTDTPDKINYDLLEKRARLVFYTAWEMANRDAMLKRDIPLN